jgi:hypothetical protein
VKKNPRRQEYEWKLGECLRKSHFKIKYIQGQESVGNVKKGKGIRQANKK